MTRLLDILQSLSIAMLATLAVLAFAGCPPPEPTESGKDTHSEFWGADDFDISVHPKPSEFEDLVEVVETFHAQLPSDISSGLDHATKDQLRSVLSWSYIDDVVEYAGEDTQEMGVEFTVGLVDVPYADLVDIMPPQYWGLNLEHYLGGELLPMEGVEGGQYERMVLSAMPCDIDVDLVNNDMTKAEIVTQDKERARVYWRVYHSDNDTTDTDVGSVTFQAYDETSTLITFHSAHVIKGLGGWIDLVPSGIWGVEDAMLGALEEMFADFIGGYQVLIEDGYDATWDSEGGEVTESGTIEGGEWHDFGPFVVAEGSSLLALLDGTGDADLYVRVGALPDLTAYDCRPWLDGSEEACEVKGPGPVYVSVYGYDDSSDYTLEVAW